MPPLLKPKVYWGGFGTSGLSLGKYYGPGVYSSVLSCIYKINIYIGNNILLVLFLSLAQVVFVFLISQLGEGHQGKLHSHRNHTWAYLIQSSRQYQMTIRAAVKEN